MRLPLLPDGSVHAFGRAVERLELEIRGCVFERRWLEVAREELRILQRDLDHQALACRVEMQALDRSQCSGMKQSARGLTGLLDVLVQHAGRVIAGFDHERIALEVANRMSERGAGTILRVLPLVQIDGA